MKRYNDSSNQHTYHADSTATSPRLLAVLIYLNEVEAGGETVFLNQGLAVKPKCGRVLVFPTAFTYIHAGRRPHKGRKYVVANFFFAKSEGMRVEVA